MIQARSPDFWRATLALCIGSIMVFSNLYITQPLLPQVRDYFAIDSLAATWSLSVTTLALGSCLLLFGPLSDAVGRRVVILSSLVLLCLTTFVTAFASDYALHLVLRALQGVFIAGLPAAALAYLGEELDPEALLLAVGLYIGANSLGGVSGRLISGLAADAWGWQSSFLALAGFDLLCLLLVFWLPPPSRRFVPKPMRIGGVLRSLGGHLNNPLILVACLIGGLNFFIFVNQYSYITFRLSSEAYGLSSHWLGMLFLTYLTGTLAAGFSGRLAKKRSQPGMMGLGILLFMIGTLFTLSHELVLIVVGLFINACGFFLTHSLASGWVTRHAVTARGSATSLYLVFYYTGATLGGFYFEPFWDKGGWPGVVIASWLVLSVTFSLSVWLSLRERRGDAKADLLQVEPLESGRAG
ncbi:MAG: MFS transporter [Candidatus Thiodiazotropha sp.]